MHRISALAGAASCQFRRIRLQPNFQADFAGIHCPHNGFGVEMLIFLKYDGHLSNLD